MTPRLQNNRTVTSARVPTVLIVDHRRHLVVNVNVVIATSPRRHLSRVIIVTVRDELQRWMKVVPIDLRNLRERPCSSDHCAANALPLHDATSPSTACSSAVVTHDSAGTSTVMNDAAATRRRRSSDVLLFISFSLYC